MFSSFAAVVDGTNMYQTVRDIGGPLGLEVDYSIQKRTNLLIGKRSCPPPLHSSKVKQAKLKHIPMVDLSFLLDSKKQGILLPIEDYQLLLPANNVQEIIPGDLPSLPPVESNAMQRDNKKITQAPISNEKHQITKQKGWREAKVFISSTFRDMHGERDFLTKFIFPELQDRCNELKIHVHVVDLRWGVTEEEAQNGATLQLCLDKIDECRPFFIGLLGTRYGWVPEKYTLSPSSSPPHPKYKWLLDSPPGLSVTHLEMIYGSLAPISNSSTPLIYIRDPAFIADVPNEFVSDFLCEGHDAELNLNQLKETLRREGHVKMDKYPCRFKGVQDGKPMTGHLEALGSNILENLWTQIQDKFPRIKDTLTPLQRLKEQHDGFIESHSRLFVGRTSYVQELDHATLPHSQYEGHLPFLVVGSPGSGKTSLVSAFARNAMNRVDQRVISHFIGGVPGSSSLRLMLLRLCQELWVTWELGNPVDVPQAYADLEAEFLKLLSPSNEERTPVLLIIDALNQFEETNSPWTLQWLPKKLHQSVCLVTSTIGGIYYDRMAEFMNGSELTVYPLSEEESKQIVTERLAQYSKKLNNRQMDILLKKKESSKPLYLTIACEELRVFGVFEKLDERIQLMAPTVPELFVEVLLRLENDFGSTTIRALLSLLACSRQGVSVHEIRHILGEWDNPMVHSLQEYKPMDGTIWGRIERGLREYLSVSGDGKETALLSFFHEQLLIAVRKAYLQEPIEDENDPIHTQKIIPQWKRTHSKLREYFQLSSDPHGDLTWKGDPRSISELPYHAICAKEWKNAINICCDLTFMEGKIRNGFTFDLLHDFILLLEKKNQEQILAHYSLDLDECRSELDRAKQFHQFLKARTYILHKRPHLTFTVALSLPESSFPCRAAQARWNSGLECRTHIRWENKPSQSNPCSMTLSGHTMVVTSCAISQNIERPLIASASHDLSVRLWNPDTGEQMACLLGHTRSIECCAFSPDGKYLATCAWDKTLRIWNTESFQEELCLSQNHTTVLLCCAFSPTGTELICGDRKGNIFIYSTLSYGSVSSSSFQFQRMISAHKGDIHSLAYCPQGSFIASTSDDNTVKIWRSSSFRLLSSSDPKKDHTKGVLGCTFSPDSSLLATCSSDKSVILWQIDSIIGSLEKISTLNGHGDGVVGVAFSPIRYELISASHDNIIVRWDLEDLSQPKSWYLGHTGSVFCCQFMPDGERFISSSFDRSVKVWEANYNLESSDVHTGRILGVSMAKGGAFIATASRDKTAKIWNISDPTKARGVLVTMEGHESNIFECSLSPDSHHLATASRDRTARIFDVRTGRCERILRDHKGYVWSVAYSPDGLLIATAGADKVVLLWDSLTGKCIGKLYGHRDEVLCVAFSPNGEKIITASKDNTLKLWNTKRRRKLATFCGHTKAVSICSFSPDSTKVLSGSEDNLVKEWSAVNAKCLYTLSGHEDTIKGCCYSADGRRIITVSTDSMAILWDSISKREICSFACLSRITCLQSSDLGSSFAVGDGAGVLYSLKPVGDEISDQADKEISHF